VLIHNNIITVTLGHGTAYSLTYQYSDTTLTNAATGTVYYRLQQVDTNGKVTYYPLRVLSAVVALGTKAEVASYKLQVYSNPAHELVMVDGSAGTHVQVLNVHRQLVASTVVAASGRATLPVVGLTPGFYVVQCSQQRTKLTVN
jgi:hypothetical protein